MLAVSSRLVVSAGGRGEALTCAVFSDNLLPTGSQASGGGAVKVSVAAASRRRDDSVPGFAAIGSG